MSRGCSDIWQGYRNPIALSAIKQGPTCGLLHGRHWKKEVGENLMLSDMWARLSGLIKVNHRLPDCLCNLEESVWRICRRDQIHSSLDMWPPICLQNSRWTPAASVQTGRQTAHHAAQFHSDGRDPNAHGRELDTVGRNHPTSWQLACMNTRFHVFTNSATCFWTLL